MAFGVTTVVVLLPTVAAGLFFFTPVQEHVHNLAAHNSKILCSALFISGRSIDEAKVNSLRMQLPGDAVRVDDRSVRYTALGITRTSVYVGDQGCIALPAGSEKPSFTPQTIAKAPRSLPIPRRLDDDLQSAIEETFASTGRHAAALVIQGGVVIAEHYADGFDAETKFESWSMGKSLTATLIGLLIQEGRLALDQPAPIAEWSEDARAEITVAQLLRMSSGLRFSDVPYKKGRIDFGAMLRSPLPDHIAVYSGMEDVFAFSLAAPTEFLPGTMGRYRNCDPLTLGAIVRRIVEEAGEDYLQWPQHRLFDKLGTDGFVLETDARGNFILSGFDYGTAEAWARLALLYLNDGRWQGESLISESFVDFVRTPAPAWERGEYGGQFWLDAATRYGLPDDTYCMLGSGGQKACIIPSYDAVLVRFGPVNAPRNEAPPSLMATIDEHLTKRLQRFDAEPR